MFRRGHLVAPRSLQQTQADAKIPGELRVTRAGFYTHIRKLDAATLDCGNQPNTLITYHQHTRPFTTDRGFHNNVYL